MLTYKVDWWVGVSKCLRNHKNHWKRPNWPRRKAARVYNLLLLDDSYKLEKFDLQSEFSSSKLKLRLFEFLATKKVKKYFREWVGFRNTYIILRVGHGKCLHWITRWVGGVKKGHKYAYVIFELSLTRLLVYYGQLLY